MRQHHNRRRRLEQIVIRPQAQAKHLLHVLIARGEHQNGAGVTSTNFATNFKPILARQIAVEHHRVGLQIEDAFHCTVATALMLNPETMLFQIKFQ